jgi:cytochrome c peroxidase
MPARPVRGLLLLVCLVAISGAWSARESAQAAVEEHAGIIGATVGRPFKLELRDPGQVTLEPTPNGLRVAKGAITGSPQRPMVMRALVERTGLTSTGTDTTWIVVFAGALNPPVLPSSQYQYRGGSLEIPPHLSAISIRTLQASREMVAARENPTTDAGATLGRVLFYDRRLSANDAVSCASCHHQSAGFGDTARLSRGFDGKETGRHSMALANVRFTSGSGFFWDLRAKTLEEQVLMPIQDGIEMGMTLADLERKLKLIPYYPALYNDAFGSPEITVERTARALAQFLRALVTSDSPFDRAFSPGNVAPDVTRLTSLQQEGFQVFQRSRCSSCHFSSTQIVAMAMNTGLDSIPPDTGAGRGAFRAPSLRNVGVSAPYMHDGRFKTLDEVIDFYSTGVKASGNLDVRLRDPSTMTPRRLDLSADQRLALKAFLHALTDSTFLTAPELSDPFRKR